MAATYEPIASQTLGSNSSSISFTSIPATYTDLVLIVECATTSNTSSFIRFNSDSGSNYSDTALGGNGSSAYSNRRSNQTQINGIQPYTTRNTFRIQIMSYANTNVYKTVLSEQASPSNVVARRAELWRDTSAISSIGITSNHDFVSGSTFSLYGIKDA